MAFLRRYIGIFILLLLVGGSAWIILSTERSLHQKDQQTVVADAYFKNTQYKQFNSKGKLILTLNSPYLTLNKQENRLDADNPKLVAYNSDNTYWLIDGDHMTTDTKTHVTTLRGHVVLYKPATEKDPSVTLKSDHFTLYPHDKAFTDAPVSLMQGSELEVHGTGCVIDLKTNTVKVLAHTDTLITPQKKDGAQANSNSQQPSRITSDSAIFHKETSIVEFFGHVVSKQGNAKSWSNYAKGFGDKSGQITKIVLSGKPAKYTTLSDDDPYPITASADTIIDYPDKNIVYLEGNAVAHHGTDSIEGDKIWYDKINSTIKSVAVAEKPTKTVFTTKPKRK